MSPSGALAESRERAADVAGRYPVERPERRVAPSGAPARRSESEYGGVTGDRPRRARPVTGPAAGCQVD